MTLRLYLEPLFNGEVDPKRGTSDDVAANVSVSGLIEQAGVSVEPISTESVDVVVNGRFTQGNRFTPKLKRELESLAESTYSALPLFDTDRTLESRGYYDIETVSVSEHPQVGSIVGFSLGLTNAGTQETHYRAVKTTVEDIETGLAAGSGGLVGVPATESKAQWYSKADGKSPATATSTVSAEFGDVELFDPTSTTISNPTLLYQVPFSDEGAVDVRVYDDLGESKYFTTGGGTDINQWPHAYHGGWEFDGAPVIDNGLVRVRFDEANSVVEGFEWNDSGSSWDAVSLPHGDLELYDFDIQDIGPAGVRTLVTFQDTTDDSLSECVVRVQRGMDGVIVRYPPGGATATAIESLFDPLASDQTTDPQPSQTTQAKSDL